MSDIKWIKITTNMFDDEKIRIIESFPDADAILVIWIKLLVQAGRTNANGYIFLNENIPYTEEMIATIFNRPLNTVRLALETFRKFGMIEWEQNGIVINNWEKHQNVEGMEKIREQNRLRVRKHRELKKLEEAKNEMLPVTLRNAPELDLDKSKKVLIAQFFESVWKLYPEKKGKAKVSNKKKQELYNYGYDVISKCIDRYKQNKKDWQEWQNGSTFFNSGYVDYLDENYATTDEPKPQAYMTRREQVERGLLTE